MLEPLYIFGAGQTAAAIHAMISDERLFDVVGFCLDRTHIIESTFEGRPIIPIEDADRSVAQFIAIGFNDLNHDRRVVFERLKQSGHRFATVISRKAVVRSDCRLGENCLVMEFNNIQAGVGIGDNTYLWSGNHVGHHSAIGAHCYVSSHCVISGAVSIGDHTFMGVNSTVGDNITIGAGCIVGQGAVVAANLPDFAVVRSPEPRVDLRSANFNRRLLRR